MPPAPSSTPPSSSRAQHAERNVRLDPQGIYGTRSARRQSQLRRRRQAQNGLLWAVFALASAALMRWATQPRQGVRATTQVTVLPFRPAGALLSLEAGAEANDLLFSSQSGGLWRASSLEDGEIQAPQRLLSAAFAPAAAPLVTRAQIFWPGGDGTLVALDRKTGRAQWRASLASALTARPAVFSLGGRALVVAGDDAGDVAAFDAQSGTLLWKAALGGAVGAGIGVLDALNGAGAGVLVPLLAGAASRGGLVCLDGKTGAVRWRFPGDARSQSGGIATPIALGNRVFWCNDEGAVMCLDGATGRKIWKSFAGPLDGASPGASKEASPSAATSQNGSGEKLVMLRGAPTLVEAAGVMTVGGNDGTLRAFDLATGAPRWTRNLGGAVRFAAQKLSFEGKNALLATGEAPAIWIIEAQTGAVLRRWSTPYDNSFGVAFSRENLYALDAEGHLQTAPLR